MRKKLKGKKLRKLLLELKELGIGPPKQISHYLKLIYCKILRKKKKFRKFKTAYQAYDALPEWKYKYAIIKKINRLPMIDDY